MATWWLTLGPGPDVEYPLEAWTSYDEIKTRGVIAQGFRNLGDLSPLLPLVIANDQAAFHQKIEQLAQLVYGQTTQAMLNLWNLMRIRSGDLIVARKTAPPEVVGVCQATRNGWQNYRYDPGFEYAQTVSHPVKWVDWDDLQAEGPPNPPGMIAGIVGLVAERDQVIQAWVNYINQGAQAGDA